MKISVLIPQLFYDVIGRIIPGATLIATAFFLFEGAMKGRRHLTTWTTSTDDISVPVVFVILGNLLGSHVVGSLLGGLWFRLYRIDLIKHGEEQPTNGLNAFMDGPRTEKPVSIISTTPSKNLCQSWLIST